MMVQQQYVISDTPSIKLCQFIKDTNENPSVVWQQQMDMAYVKTYKIVHNDRPYRSYKMDYTKDFETQFRPSELIEYYNPQYIDPEYGKDSLWDDELCDQENLQLRHDNYPPTDDENDPEVKDNELSRALSELSEQNSEANNQEEIEEYQRQEVHLIPNRLLDEKAFLHVLVTKEGELAYIPFPTNTGLKLKRRMLYFPMDFGELTLDSLIDTGPPSSAIPKQTSGKYAY